ncbi:tumor necrosis factor receptor superfamily member 5-like [Nerophis lumbriciformis]|uniref:tumor necrosis factor receptor superfamily member 5-like n=1 Tax=Nerophis lumbriciformis TaxID=546530 RepID=UPI002ADF35A3|nr:tumor necrosis factor receptor superfamily member 9-like [Nerophis lumbriciformis]
MKLFLCTLSLRLLLLAGSPLCSLAEQGCKIWNPSRTVPKTKEVCCEECHPGNRLVKECGRDPKTLCTPCESETYTKNPKAGRCDRCTQCEGAQVLVKECTTTSDTQCGCKDGLLCGDHLCSFCYKNCSKGEEPGENRNCRKCAKGTFNDQLHQPCKPWSKICPYPNQRIVAGGDAFSDIKCINISHSNQFTGWNHEAYVWPIVLSVVLLSILLVIIMAVSVLQGKRTTKRKKAKQPIIRTPTDEPLMAIECSFHEVEEQQGCNILDSLVFKEPQEHFVA